MTSGDVVLAVGWALVFVGSALVVAVLVARWWR